MMTRRVLVGSTGDPVGNPGMPVRRLTLVLFDAVASVDQEEPFRPFRSRTILLEQSLVFVAWYDNASARGQEGISRTPGVSC
jgi:hypothetical protein